MPDQTQCPNCGHYRVSVYKHAFLPQVKNRVQVSESEAWRDVAVFTLVVSFFTCFMLVIPGTRFLGVLFLILFIIGFIAALLNVGKAKKGEYYKTKFDKNSGGSQYKHQCGNCNWTQYENRYRDGRREMVR